MPDEGKLPPGVVSRPGTASETFEWGEISWRFDGTRTPGAAMSFGRMAIAPGAKNPLHTHPNCEEILYLVSGRILYSYDGKTVHLGPGDAIRLPAGIRHDARNIGGETAVMVVCFSSPDRRLVVHEEPVHPHGARDS